MGQVTYLVGNHPTTLAERNLFGHTPLHLAADKPDCLRILVETADAGALEKRTDVSGFDCSVLETAVFVSGMLCQESTEDVLCQGCPCAESAAILLEADCAVPTSYVMQAMFHSASFRCKLLCIHHMKDRRTRLRQLALDNLAETHVKRLGLDESKRVLDYHAPEVIRLLQAGGVSIAGSLAVQRSWRYISLYQMPKLIPATAELLFQAGFQDVDSWWRGQPEGMSLSQLHWLAEHGATSCWLRHSPSKSADHARQARLLFGKIGSELGAKVGGGYLTLSGRDSIHAAFALEARHYWINKLHEAVLSAEGMADDACRCCCSFAGCTPFTALWRGLTDTLTSWHLRRFMHDPEAQRLVAIDLLRDLIVPLRKYLGLFGFHLEAKHYATALRYMTFTALGTQHTCCRIYYNAPTYNEAREHRENKKEDSDDNENGGDLALLEELLEEFEAKVTNIHCGPDWKVEDMIAFWEHEWLPRMVEVLEELRADRLSDEERRAAEEIGVVWDKPQPLPQASRNPFKYVSLEYWIYELNEIEAEWR